jgi:hypothetical protein
MSDETPDVEPTPPTWGESVARHMPLFVEVPGDQLDDMKPGNPVFDAAMEYAKREHPGAGFLLIPREINFPDIPVELLYDSTAIHQNLPRPDDAQAEMLRSLAAVVDSRLLADILALQSEGIRYPTRRWVVRDGKPVEVCPECSDAQCPLWLPLRAEIAGDDVDLATMARLNLRDDHRVTEPSCTVCGGDGCDLFFCYVTEK